MVADDALEPRSNNFIIVVNHDACGSGWEVVFCLNEGTLMVRVNQIESVRGQTALASASSMTLAQLARRRWLYATAAGPFFFVHNKNRFKVTAGFEAVHPANEEATCISPKYVGKALISHRRQFHVISSSIAAARFRAWWRWR